MPKSSYMLESGRPGRIIRRLLIFLAILLLAASGYLGYHLLGFNYLLFGARDAGVSVETWLDRNANGSRGSGEPPLSGVCIWAGYTFARSEALTLRRQDALDTAKRFGYLLLLLAAAAAIPELVVRAAIRA